MSEERAEAEREAARRAGRGTMSHIDEDAMKPSQDSRESQSEDPHAVSHDGQQKGGPTSR